MRKQYYHLHIDDLNTDEALSKCKSILSSKGEESTVAATLFFLNAHCFNVSLQNEKYRQALLSCSMVLNDGIGIKLGGMLKRIRFKQNMNGTDFIPKLIELSAIEKKGVFLLGGAKNIAKNAAHELKKRISGIQIKGTRSGFFKLDETNDVIRLINESNAELLIVGMGVPRQEIWLYENLSNLKSIKLVVGGGAILDFISGNVRRAPLIMRRTGIEWFYRFLREPSRLWRRYILGNPLFFYNIMIGNSIKKLFFYSGFIETS